MYGFLLTRLLHTVFVILGVAVVVFFLIRLTGDPVALYLPPEATAQEMQEMRTRLGYDRPLVVQLGDFLLGIARGDFGESIRFREPAMRVTLSRLPATLQLASLALCFAILVAIPLGIFSALRKNTLWDLGATTVALLGQCMPTFWLGIVAILIFAVHLGWLPTSGSGSFAHLVLPSVTLGAYSAGILVRLVRASVLEVLAQDFIRTATSKGLQRWVVIYKHALKNAALPTITVIGLQFSVLMGGSIVTEQVFSYPGMARLALQAVASRDIPIVQSFVILTAGVIVVINLAVDLIYLVLDPRISYG